MVVKFTKSEFRIHVKNELKKLNSHQAKCVSASIARKTLKLVNSLKVKNILIFIPLPYEPDLLKLRAKFTRNRNLFVPFMVNESLKAVKLRMPFKTAKFGVREAGDSNAHFGRIDLAVIPVIGVDAKMARIGHGAGFYDRFFASLPYRPTIVFVQIKDFFLNADICDSHDIKGDFYITPSKIYMRKNYDRSDNRRLLLASRRRGGVFSS